MVEARMVEERLSDGSKAYNVVITQLDELANAQTIILPANTAGQADRIVATFVELVNRHTAEQAKRTD